MSVFVTHIFNDPVRHFAPEMKARIIYRTGNAMIFIGIVRTFKVDIAFNQGRYHLGGILKMNIVVRSAMNEQYR